MITVDYTQLVMHDPLSNAHKFYCVFMSSHGRVLRWWGRINTKGQQKEEDFGNGGHAAAYAHGNALISDKQSKGYRIEYDDQFQMRAEEWGDAETLLAHQKAVDGRQDERIVESEQPPYSVGTLLERASELLGQQAVDIEEVAQLRADYTEVAEQLETAKAAIDMLTRRVMGG
jgi:predicted DNA-binding WGR domain protein